VITQLLPFQAGGKVFSVWVAERAGWLTFVDESLVKMYLKGPLPELAQMEGMQLSILRRLWQLGILSPNSLTASDPIEIARACGIPVVTAIDFVDQAFLFLYFKEEVIALLRRYGIRGVSNLLSAAATPPEDRMELQASLRSHNVELVEQIDVIKANPHVIQLQSLRETA